MLLKITLKISKFSYKVETRESFFHKIFYATNKACPIITPKSASNQLI